MAVRTFLATAAAVCPSPSAVNSSIMSFLPAKLILVPSSELTVLMSFPTFLPHFHPFAIHASIFSHSLNQSVQQFGSQFSCSLVLADKRNPISRIFLYLCGIHCTTGAGTLGKDNGAGVHETFQTPVQMYSDDIRPMLR